MAYSSEFKMEVIQKCIDGYTSKEISRLYGVTQASIDGWRRQLITTGNLDEKPRQSKYKKEVLQELLDKNQAQRTSSLPGNLANTVATRESFNHRKGAEFIETRFKSFKKQLFDDEIFLSSLKKERSKSPAVPEKPVLWSNHPALCAVPSKQRLSATQPMTQEDMLKKYLVAQKYVSSVNCGTSIDFVDKEQWTFNQSSKIKSTLVSLRAADANYSQTQCMFIRESSRYFAKVVLSNHTGSVQGFLALTDLEGNENIIELDEYCMLSSICDAGTDKPEEGIFTYFNIRYNTLLVEPIIGTPRLYDVKSVADAVIANRKWQHIDIWDDTVALPENIFKEIYGGTITVTP